MIQRSAKQVPHQRRRLGGDLRHGRALPQVTAAQRPERRQMIRCESVPIQEPPVGVRPKSEPQGIRRCDARREKRVYQQRSPPAGIRVGSGAQHHAIGEQCRLA